MQLRIKWKYTFSLVIIMGLVTPFINYFTIIEFFFLIIPFGIIVFVSLCCWIVSLFQDKMNSLKSFYFFLIIPVFVLTQLFSAFTINKIQRFRCENIVMKIEEEVKLNGILLDQLSFKFGIEYKKSKRDKKFEISYSRGFMVTEKFDSDTKNWKSYSWND